MDSRKKIPLMTGLLILASMLIAVFLTMLFIN